MNHTRKIIAVVLLAGMLAGCAGMGTREQRMLSGGAIGAAGGAAIGAAAGGSPAAGAAIGGVVGVAAGFVVDEIDRRKSESPKTN